MACPETAKKKRSWLVVVGEAEHEFVAEEVDGAAATATLFETTRREEFTMDGTESGEAGCQEFAFGGIGENVMNTLIDTDAAGVLLQHRLRLGPAFRMFGPLFRVGAVIMVRAAGHIMPLIHDTDFAYVFFSFVITHSGEFSLNFTFQHAKVVRKNEICK